MTAAILVLAFTIALCTVPTVPLVVTYLLLLPKLRTRGGRVALRVASAFYLGLVWRLAAALDAERFSLFLGSALAYACAAAAGLLLVGEARFAIRVARHRRLHGPEPPRCPSCRQRAMQAVASTAGEAAGGMYGLEGTQMRCEACGALSWVKR